MRSRIQYLLLIIFGFTMLHKKLTGIYKFHFLIICIYFQVALDAYKYSNTIINSKRWI